MSPNVIPLPGERYGYRQGAKGDFEQVEFVRWGRGRQRKVLVRFLDEDDAEEWVIPRRLQVLWADVDQRRQDEANWARLTTASPPLSEGLKMAVGWTVDTLLEPGVMEHSMDQGGGVSLLIEVATIEQAAGEHIPPHNHSFESERGRFVPRDITLSIARALASRNPGRIGRLVDEQQAQWAEKEQRNKILRAWAPKHPQDIADDEDMLLSWRYLREWAATGT